MTYLRRAILAVALIAGTPAFAQVAPPVPALPDTERRTSYSITASTCVCAVGFQLFGDSTDVANWLEVFVNGALIPQSGNWTVTSPTGSLTTIPRPITDAVLTFTVAQTGTVQIVGARRPRRTSQFQEGQPVPTRNLNVVFSDIIATQRELWDKTNDLTGRGVFAPPGETLALLPVLASRMNQGACFSSTGSLTVCATIPSGAFIAGNGILFTGTGPTTITNNISAGAGVQFTGANPIQISVPTAASTNTPQALGALCNGVFDDTAAFQAAVNAGNTTVPPGVGNCMIGAAGLTIPSHRYIWIQKGTTVVFTGGRLTAYLPGGGDVQIRNDGVLSFLATTTAADLTGWPAGQRGLIEFGGTHFSPAVGFSLFGQGRVFSDYVWTGTYVFPTAAMLNRKGIMCEIAARCLVEGQEIDHIYGEAVYMNGYETTFDVKFFRNYIHDVAFDALNFNMTLSAAGLEIAHNYVLNAQFGIEMSTGNAHDNYIQNVFRGIIFGAGSGIGPIVVAHNQVVTTTDTAYDLEFGSLIQNVFIFNNASIGAGTTAYIVANVQDFQFKSNSSYNHARVGAGTSYNFLATTSNGQCEGNITMANGTFSTGTFINGGGCVVTAGNPAF